MRDWTIGSVLRYQSGEVLRVPASNNNLLRQLGRGPDNNPATWGGKLFAGLYALYCGLVVIVTMGVLIAPVLHRAVHLFH